MNEKVNARIQALEAELAGLKKELAEPKKEGRFRAKRNKEYKTIRLDKGKFVIFESIDSYCNVDNSRYNNFNHFRPDTNEADRMDEKINLLLAMTARVKELNGDWVADWEDNNQFKFGILFNKPDLFTSYYSTSNPFIFGLYVQSKEHAEILLEEFKERIEKYY